MVVKNSVTLYVAPMKMHSLSWHNYLTQRLQCFNPFQETRKRDNPVCGAPTLAEFVGGCLHKTNNRYDSTKLGQKRKNQVFRQQLLVSFLEKVVQESLSVNAYLSLLLQ